MTTQTHSLLAKHYAPQNVIDAVVKHAAEHRIDLNTVTLNLNTPMMLTVGEPKCGHLLFVMAGMRAKLIRIGLADGQGNLIRELETVVV